MTGGGRSIGWGIIGTGAMAASFAAALRAVEDGHLAAVASRTRAGAAAFAERFGRPRVCADYHELLADPAVDVVYVATPHASHSALCLAALAAGRPVLCEKPFAINAAQAQAVIDLARERRLFLMEAMWTRFVPALVKLRELLAERVIGDVQMLLAGGAYIPEVKSGYYLLEPELGGGILLDAGVYLVSMASMVFGRPQQILAMGELGASGVDEHEAVLLKHPGGAIASLYVSHRSRAAPDCTLLGSQGRIHLHPPVFCPAGLTLSVAGLPEEHFEFDTDLPGYAWEIREVHRCLREGLLESPRMPLNETLAIMHTMDEIRRQLGLRYPADG